jgi:hypothetical protein
MNWVDQIKDHWILKVIGGAVFCIGTTWVVINEISVKPRDFVIEQQKASISDLRDKLREPQSEGRTSGTQAPAASNVVLPPTWVNQNQPLLALDNQLLVKVTYASDFSRTATFDLEIPEQETLHWGVIVWEREKHLRTRVRHISLTFLMLWVTVPRLASPRNIDIGSATAASFAD